MGGVHTMYKQLHFLRRDRMFILLSWVLHFRGGVSPVQLLRGGAGTDTPLSQQSERDLCNLCKQSDCCEPGRGRAGVSGLSRWHVQDPRQALLCDVHAMHEPAVRTGAERLHVHAEPGVHELSGQQGDEKHKQWAV